MFRESSAEPQAGIHTWIRVSALSSVPSWPAWVGRAQMDSMLLSYGTSYINNLPFYLQGNYRNEDYPCLPYASGLGSLDCNSHHPYSRRGHIGTVPWSHIVLSLPHFPLGNSSARRYSSPGPPNAPSHYSGYTSPSFSFSKAESV